MTDLSASLGPLERVDSRWVVGDCRPGGTWVEFRADGLYQHARNSEGELIPWSRVMLATRVTLGAKYPRDSYGGWALLDGLPGPWRGRGRGYLHLTLRHPYEDRLAAFDRHPRRYRSIEFLLLEELLTQAADAGEAHRLGDPDWLGRAVERLARQRPKTIRGIRQAVTEARQGVPAALAGTGECG
ncbi:hypothetical protein [Streptomyces albireticuli]|uniref:hypothetical protein n=1 Tax=Streptomyces albireticuli TaxID=1940 RepID=UPI001F213979|nr:hypothetical protein [Streptomyces albireticuli]